MESLKQSMKWDEDVYGRECDLDSYMIVSVERIADVVTLRSSQFVEDAGPNAHPVRPEKFIDISNFYTATVYEKGAELCRMLRILLGTEGFRKGTDLYFDRHDGQTVTVEDFVAALADANGRDFSQFLQWYCQAGTPVVRVDRKYDAASRTYTLTVSQNTAPTPDGSEKRPLHMPMVTALLGRDGREMPLRLRGEKAASGNERVLEICEAKQEFVFEDVAVEPVPSLFRGFSAPINLDVAYSDAEMIFLMANDTDAFNRWEAGQKILTTKLLALAADHKQGRDLAVDEKILDALFATVQNKQLDDHFKALMLTLPALDVLMQKQDEICVESLYAASKFVERKLAQRFAGDMLEV